MNKIKIAFFGTHEFAAYILEGLIESPFIEVALVVTQPDQKVGRKQVLTAPLTKVIAQKHNIPVVQPTTLKNFELPLSEFDLSIVIEYGRIIPERLLSVGQYGTINIHPSLLPLYRGPTPIQAALLHGDTKTGVTIMQMDATMDTGPILLQRETVIAPDDTFITLREKLMPLALDALMETIPGFIDGNIKPQAQDNNLATYCKLMSRDDGRIDFTKTAGEIYNQYRAYTPWPGIWTMLDGKRLKLLDIAPTELSTPQGQLVVTQGHISIGTAQGSLEIRSLQLEGKPVMDAKTFANGYKSLDGSALQ